MEAKVTIITKYGFKKPSLTDLQQGELGVDLLGKVLYTRDGSDQIIEVGGGNINWSQINPDTIPPQLIQLIDGTVNLDQLISLIGGNTEGLAELDADLKALALVVNENTRLIGVNKADIATNDQSIKDLTLRVGANESGVSTNKQGVKDNKEAIEALTPRVGKNEQDILDLQGIVNGDLTGLYLGGTYRLPANKVEDVTNAGTLAGINVGDTLDQHAKEDNKGMYFVIEGSGTLGGLFRDSSNGQQGQNGDWLVCDGVHGWILMSFGGDHVAWGSIGGNIENQLDLQQALATKLEEGDTIDGGKFQ